VEREGARRSATSSSPTTCPSPCPSAAKGLFDGTSPNFVGDLGVGADATLVSKAKECDLFLALGTRMGEPVSQGYTLLDMAGATPIVQVHQDQAEIGRVYRPALGITSDLNAFAAAARAAAPVADPPWSGWTRELRAAREAQAAAPEVGGPLDVARALQALEKALPPDTIFTTDAGNFATWPTRFMHVSERQDFLGPTNGAMGYGVPAAIGAAIVPPDRCVVCFVGDGGMLMTGRRSPPPSTTRSRPSCWCSTTRCTAPSGCTRKDLPRPRLRHRADQPGLRALHRELRRPRRGGGAHGRPRARLRARPRQRQAGADRAPHRPGADHQPLHGRAAARTSAARGGGRRRSGSGFADAAGPQPGTAADRAAPALIQTPASVRHRAHEAPGSCRRRAVWGVVDTHAGAVPTVW
jgi:hypothetical protein